MTQRSKLELPVNQPITIELLYDEPISGSSRYGKYNMYAVSINGEEFSYFPPEEVHDKIKNLQKGDRATITKLAAQRGNKLVTAYDVQLENKQLPVAPNTVKEENKETEIEDSEPADERKSSATNDDFYNIMLQCYRDSLNINRELNGFGDADKLAITLFIARTKNH